MKELTKEYKGNGNKHVVMLLYWVNLDVSEHPEIYNARISVDDKTYITYGYGENNGKTILKFSAKYDNTDVEELINDMLSRNEIKSILLKCVYCKDETIPNEIEHKCDDGACPIIHAGSIEDFKRDIWHI